MPAGNNNFVDTDAKIKDFLNAVLSSEGIVVDIRRTFINYNGVNRSRVFARRANEMASKGGNEKFVVIALMCYPALQWILQAQDIDRLVEELREQNPDESVSRMSNIQRVLESSLGGCKPQLRLEMRKVFFARCQQLVDDYYGQTLINQGNDDTLDSETQPNISLDRSHMYCAWIGDIELPVNTKTEYNVLSKHNDAGFIRLLTSFDLKKVEDLYCNHHRSE